MNDTYDMTADECQWLDANIITGGILKLNKLWLPSEMVMEFVEACYLYTEVKEFQF